MGPKTMTQINSKNGREELRLYAIPDCPWPFK
jgi:hypothetical protein